MLGSLGGTLGCQERVAGQPREGGPGIGTKPGSFPLFRLRAISRLVDDASSRWVCFGAMRVAIGPVWSTWGRGVTGE
jgi:hypothetical protein